MKKAESSAPPRCTGRARSIALDLCLLDELRERGVVVAGQPIELLRRADPRGRAMFGEQIAYLLLAQNLAQRGVVPGDDVRRHAGRAPGREPGVVVEILGALLVQRRQFGRER